VGDDFELFYQSYYSIQREVRNTQHNQSGAVNHSSLIISYGVTAVDIRNIPFFERISIQGVTPEIHAETHAGLREKCALFILNFNQNESVQINLK
jgi:hypothetical protein